MFGGSVLGNFIFPIVSNFSVCVSINVHIRAKFATLPSTIKSVIFSNSNVSGSSKKMKRTKCVIVSRNNFPFFLTPELSENKSTNIHQLHPVVMSKIDRREIIPVEIKVPAMKFYDDSGVLFPVEFRYWFTSKHLKRY